MTKSKSARIRHLLKQGMRPKEVAGIIGCSADYVRAVRQRTDKKGNSARSPAQRRWAARRATDPKFRKREAAASARYRAKCHRRAAEAVT